MAMRVLLLAASAAVSVLAQAPSDHSSGCTTKSFTIPSWLIQDLKQADGAISFGISNRATNYTANLQCETKKTGLNACAIQGKPSSNDTLDASVEVSSGATVFHLKQSWTCNDREKALTFTAVGNNSAALNYTSPLLIRGSLTSPVTITPAYPDGPTGHASPGCSSKSQKPGWTLSAIHFTDEPGDGANTAPFQNFNVLVTNPATGYQASCMPGGSLGGQPDLSQLVCAGNEFQQTTVGQYPIVTNAGFNPATGTFSINQTWYCDDTDAAKPLQITATGSLALPLQCTTEPQPNNSTNRYCTTSSATVALPGTLGTVTTLHPYVLDDPAPAAGRGDGCTLTSIFDPRWEFSEFQIANGTGDGNDGGVSFEVILAAQDRGFQFPIPIYQGQAVKGQEGWYECEIGADGGIALPLWPYRCSFRYDAAREGLELRADWACRDLDADHPVNFSGVTTTTINTTLTCDTADGQSQCTTTDPAYIWDSPISNVTWEK